MLTVTIAVAAVLTFSALLGWVFLRAATSAERAQRDSRYRRRHALVQGTISAAAGVIWIVLGTVGQQPARLCIFLGLMNIVLFIQSCINLARTPKAPRG